MSEFICVECFAAAETNCTYCGTDLCYDCLDGHEWDCPDADEIEDLE